MSFFETFSAVFIATLMAQFSSWWFKKELEHRLDRGYDRLFKRGGSKMDKLVLDVERTVNGGFIVTKYTKKESSGFGAFNLGKSDSTQFVFGDFKGVSSWIEEELKK